MLTIYLTKGLPASGKSTWAKTFITENPGTTKRINKDELRSMLDSSKWSKDNEKFILNIRNHIVKESLRKGKHVIVDDTNLHPKHERKMQEIISELKEEGIEVKLEIKDFTDVPLETCIERDLKRPNSVGEKTIKNMNTRFLNKEEPIKKREKDPNLPNCIIVDIDGTLAKRVNRSPYDLSKVKEDIMDEDIKDIITTYEVIGDQYDHAHIFIFSGREDSCKKDTEEWLWNNSISGYEKLVMRKTGDHRKDCIIKKEMFEEYIEGKYNVLFVIDDRDQVVDMWRKDLGLTCLQCSEGDF